jgi:hypothetical protein
MRARSAPPLKRRTPPRQNGEDPRRRDGTGRSPINNDPADRFKSVDGGQVAWRIPWSFAFRLRRPIPLR